MSLDNNSGQGKGREIIPFILICPKNNSEQHQANVGFALLEDGSMFPYIADCHKSAGDQTCATCLTVIKLALYHGNYPRGTMEAVSPRALPEWPDT